MIKSAKEEVHPELRWCAENTSIKYYRTTLLTSNKRRSRIASSA
ncbi:hypothetical protein RE6C_02816 [Rhodopirellula europaea 6C]|uniref:Uncharacterized protein n=1 Tax=Rhodopirellula europaea 6C TaxID=1263867 RepID=M2A6K5_9BACT|nr:hypothetical protein RE6C_02816 [Rhodopirellula europaea 6C]